ncbi:hypothetical protein D3C85_1392170 [compost metagenome]
MGGQDNHRHSGLQLLDFDKQLHPVHFIHAQVAYHQIDFLASQCFQPFRATFGGNHAVTFADQTHSQQL